MEKELKEMVDKLSDKLNDISLQAALYRQKTDENCRNIDTLKDVVKEVDDKYNYICQANNENKREIKNLSSKIDSIIGFFKKVITPLVTAFIISYIVFQLNIFKVSDNEKDFVKKIDKIMNKYYKDKHSVDSH